MTRQPFKKRAKFPKKIRKKRSKRTKVVPKPSKRLMKPNKPRVEAATKPNKPRIGATKASQQATKAPALGTQSFRDLRDKWYAKLKKEGFEDLEHIPRTEDDATRYIQTSSLAAIAKYYKPETLHYYRQWTCYLAWKGQYIRPKKDREVLYLHADGVPFREIVRRLSKSYAKGINITSIHYIIKKWKPEMESFNKTNPNGLNFTPDIGVSY